LYVNLNICELSTRMEDLNGAKKANANQLEHKEFKYIKNLTTNERKSFLDSFDMVFCDCDGVIWKTIYDTIPGSSETIDYLRQEGKQVIFVTNNSILSIQDQLKRFELCNIKINKQDLLHPAQSICDHLKSINFDGLILCLASPSFKNLLRDADFQLVEDKEKVILETVFDFRDAIFSKDPVKAVVIDVDFNLTATKLMRAHSHLKDPQCLFIGGAADTLIPFGSREVIGPGPFITVLENSSKRKAIVLGKPGKELCEMIKQRYHLQDPKRALFIGDSLLSDVKFGKMCGFQTLLVLSGSTKENDLVESLDDHETPDFVAACLGDLNEII